MRLYTDEVLSHLIYCRGFEYSEREFVSRLLRPGDTFVDIGANAGLFTLIASSVVGESGRVYAFEPSPVSFIHLMENISLNRLGNVKCIESALSDQSGKLLLYVSTDGHSAWDTFTLDQTTAAKETREVVTTTVDAFIEEEKLLGKLTMMKIDVEGWESKVLSGGGNTFSRPDAPLLQVEFVDTVAKSAGASCQDLYDMIRKYGYQLYTYDIESRQLVNETKKQEYPFVNLYAVKDLNMVNRRLSGQKSG